MLDIPWDDDEFAFFDPDMSVPELHAKTAFDNEEQLVFVLMMVPHEFALKLHQLDELTVELANDSGAPMLFQQSELCAEIDLLHCRASRR